MKGSASAVARYLAGLPDEQRAEVEAVRDVILTDGCDKKQLLRVRFSGPGTWAKAAARAR